MDLPGTASRPLDRVNQAARLDAHGDIASCAARRTPRGGECSSRPPGPCDRAIKPDVRAWDHCPYQAGEEQTEPSTAQGTCIPEAVVVVKGEREKEEEEEEEECCMICLGQMEDRTILPPCGHSLFCFGCIYRWSQQSRNCPLCLREFGHLVHDVHSERDFRRFYLRPLDAAKPARAAAAPSLPSRNPDDDDPEIAFRRSIYRRSAYALHVGSNKFTRFTPPPGPKEFASSLGLRMRARGFALRELGVWRHVCDVPGQRAWVASYLVEMAQQLDLTSDPSVRLWADLVSVPHPVAHHFLHELQHFLRSPFKTLQMWDRYVRYPPAPLHPGDEAGPRPASWDDHIGRRGDTASLSPPLPHGLSLSPTGSPIKRSWDTSVLSSTERNPSLSRTRAGKPSSAKVPRSKKRVMSSAKRQDLLRRLEREKAEMQARARQ